MLDPEQLAELRDAVARYGNPHANPAGYAELERIAAFNASVIAEGYADDFMASLFVAAVEALTEADNPATRHQILANALINLGVTALTVAERQAAEHARTR